MNNIPRNVDAFITNSLKSQSSLERIMNNQLKESQFRNAVNNNPNQANYDTFIPFGGESGKISDPDFTKKSFIKEVTRIVPVSSKDRDTSIYENSNNFKISLPRTFHNVKKIELVSSVFPNTDHAIKGPESGSLQNNQIFWQNKENIYKYYLTNITLTFVDLLDYPEETYLGSYFATYPFGYKFNIPGYQNESPRIDVFIYNANYPNFISDCTVYKMVETDSYFFCHDFVASSIIVDINMPVPTYSASITAGNYTLNSIVEELTYQMNLVPKENGDLHFFTIDVSTDTDILTFKNYELYQLTPNSLTTTSGSYVVSVNHPGHNITSNSKLRFVDCQTFNGISSSLINREQTITVVDFETYTFSVTVKASLSGSGGGTNIKVGSPLEFKFIFGGLDRYFDTSFEKNLSSILGFPSEDSNESLGVTDPLSTVTFDIIGLQQEPLGICRVILSQDPTNILFACKRFDVISAVDNLVETTVYHGIQVEGLVYLEFNEANYTVSGQTITGPISRYFRVSKVSSTRFLILDTDFNVNFIDYGFVSYGDTIELKIDDITPKISTDTVFLIQEVGTSFIDVKLTFDEYNASRLSTARVYTSLLKVNHPGHLFNEINYNQIIETFFEATPTGIDFYFLKNHTLTTLSYTGSASVTVNNTIDITTNESLGQALVVGSFININISVVSGTTGPVSGTYFCEVITVNIFRFYSQGTLTTDPAFNRTYNVYIGDFPFSISCSTGFNDLISISGAPVYSADGVYSQIYNNNILNYLRYDGLVDISADYSGTYAVFNAKRNELKLYRVKSSESSGKVYSVNLSSINAVTFKARLIADEDDYYYISLGNNYFRAENASSFGGTDVRISSDHDGFSTSRSNTIDWTTSSKLSKSISLEGENYVFLLCKNHETLIKSGLNDAFAQILLDSSPGTICFNSFITEPYYYDYLKSSLSDLEFSVVYDSGDLYDFKDIDYSFTLKITEVLNLLENKSSSTGIVNESYSKDLLVQNK
jgi:hypothetical protein